tara:strand:- start:824 stop:1018 length:195 start_codon:yes stop_codon:yes gene_type:complete
MKIVFEISEKSEGKSKEGLTNEDIDNLLDNMEVCNRDDIIEILNGGSINQVNGNNSILMYREDK